MEKDVTKEKETNTNNTTKVKKILRIVGDVVFGIFMVFILFFAISNLRAKSTNNIPNLFGRGYLTVDSDSMNGDKKDSFKTGDLITVKVLKNGSDSLKVGDIATYYDIFERKIITHRVIEVHAEDKYYVFEGDNPLAKGQTTVVTFSEILAKYTGKVEGLGATVKWCQSKVGFFVIVVLPTLLFLVVELVQFIKSYSEFKLEKATANNAISQEEREKEKEELRKQILEELKASMNSEKEETKNEEK